MNASRFVWEEGDIIIRDAKAGDETHDALTEDELDQYNPGQPRHPKGSKQAGEWMRGGVGSINPLTAEVKASMALANEGKSVDQLRLEAATNQHALAKLGGGIHKALGTKFAQPPKGQEIKSAESINRKVTTEGYKGANHLRDISRATFVVESHAQSQAVLGALGARGHVFDRGWLIDEKAGYRAQFIYLQHPNGGVSEIQLVPNGLAQYKMTETLNGNGPGHVLYEIMRNTSLSPEVRSAAARKSRTNYSRLLPKAFRGT